MPQKSHPLFRRRYALDLQRRTLLPQIRQFLLERCSCRLIRITIRVQLLQFGLYALSLPAESPDLPEDHFFAVGEDRGFLMTPVPFPMAITVRSTRVAAPTIVTPDYRSLKSHVHHPHSDGLSLFVDSRQLRLLGQ
jgi:hypothetical protein